MKFADYESIRDLITQKATAEQIADKLPHVLYDSIVSVWSSYWQEHELAALRIFRNKSGKPKEECIKQFYSGSSLFALARDRDLSPIALVREMLAERGLSKQQIKDIIKKPETMREIELDDTSASSSSSSPSVDLNLSSSASTAVRPTSLLPSLLSSIPIDRWIREIQHCVENDPHNSPFLDAVKHYTGTSYESLLDSYLTHHQIPFLSESSLRSAGKVAKTPDFLLAAPIMVHGHVVNWIDSKAQFADPKLKREHIEGQLRQYVNRCGPGMVIYWLDFVEDEKNSASIPLPRDRLGASGHVVDPTFASPAIDEDGKILLVTDFPNAFTTLGQLIEGELSKLTAPTAKPEEKRMKSKENTSSTPSAEV